MALSMQGLLYCEGTLQTQLVLAAFWALIWFGAIKASAKMVFEPFVRKQTWCQQWTELSKKTFKSAFFVEFKTDEETFECACLFLAILCQHAVGGALCIPSVLGFTGPIISAMACHGALCEAGWELQDACERLYQVAFGGEAGKAKNPPALLTILGLHHSMGLSMVIPMNMVYGDNRHYHEFVLLLQGAAFVAMLSQNYGFTLDVWSVSGLRQMKACVTVTLVTMLWSRLFRYAFIGYSLISTFVADGNAAMTYGGGSVLGLMGMLNCLFVMDACGKFLKFIKMKHADKEVIEASVAVTASCCRHSVTSVVLTKSQKEWSKIRGVYHMGLFKQQAISASKKEM